MNKIALSTLLLASLCTACGWQLRGSVPRVAAISQQGISELKIISDTRNNPFYQSLLASLTQHGIANSSESELRLEIQPEEISRRALSYSRAGVPAQYQLELTLGFQLSQGEEVLIPQREMTARRIYDFDPNLIVEKDREREELLLEMRSDLIERMLSAVAQAVR